MSYICPLCNGLLPLTCPCPNCQQMTLDQGKLEDYAGPYSPYGSIDQYRSSDGWRDESGCQHVIHCPYCEQSYIYHVNTWQMPSTV